MLLFAIQGVVIFVVKNAKDCQLIIHKYIQKFIIITESQQRQFN